MTINLGFLSSNPLFADDYILRQQSAGSYNEYDEFVPGSSTDYNLKGSVEPTSGINRTNDISAERSHETITIYSSNVELTRAVRQGAAPTEGDLIIYSNYTYMASNVNDWRTHGYLVITAIRLNAENG
jgi:hypothetical protein